MASRQITGLDVQAALAASHVSATVAPGGSVTVPDGSSVLILIGPSAASFTIKLPATAALYDGQSLRVTSAQPSVAALSVVPQAGQVAPGAPASIGPSAPFALMWMASLTTWVRI